MSLNNEERAIIVELEKEKALSTFAEIVPRISATKNFIDRVLGLIKSA